MNSSDKPQKSHITQAVWDDRFRAILDSSLDAVVTMNAAGQIVDWNRQAEQVFGWTKHEAIGQRLAALIIPPNYRDSQREGLQHYLRSGQGPILGQRVELSALRKTGEEFPVELSVVAVPLDDGVIFNAFLRDISDRTQDAEYRKRMAALVDSSYDAIIGKDITGTIISWNLGAERVYGFTEEEAVGQTIGIILPPEVEREEAEILHALQTGQRLEQFETVRRRKDGTRIPVSLTVSPIADDNATIIGSSTIERDITESKRQKEELRQAKEAAEEATRMRAEFLANVSHELRTPMNAIIGMTQITLEEDLTDDVRDYVQTANKAAHSLLTLLNDILDFSKLESGKFTIKEESFKLRETIDETVKTLSTRAFEKGLELACEVDIGAPDNLIGDRIRLRQVLTNLIGNAIKFTKQGEVVLTLNTLEKWPQGTRLQFSIRDTGVGIADEDQRRILEPFMQVDASSTRRHGGTGLGLAICTELIQLMGGRMSVESECGVGSCFSFELSFARQTDAVALATNAPDAADDDSDSDSLRVHTQVPLTVLLVEDTPANQKVVTTILKKRGHAVTVAQNGREAVEFTRRGSFDVILMDVQMPIMDGVQATAAIREQEKDFGTSTPIVAMTSHAMRGDRDKYLQAGMDAYIAKPIDTNKLIELIENICRDSSPSGNSSQKSPPRESRSVTEDVPSSSVIDFERTMQRLAGDMDLFRDFISYFDKDSPELLQRLRDAIFRDEALIVRHAAHSLKGLAANFGAEACVAAAHEMELLGETNDLAVAPELLPQLEEQFAKLATALEKHRSP